MNHQPFRDWLLADESLSEQQAKALQEHLRTCDTCNRLGTAWGEVEAVISRAALFEPASGFVERWQVRLVAQQLHQQKVKGWYVIGATSLLVVALIVLLSAQIWSIIQNPDVYVAALFDQLAGILSIIIAINSFIRSISLPGLSYTLAGMVLLFGLISFMSVLWLATYRRFSMIRRQA